MNAIKEKLPWQSMMVWWTAAVDLTLNNMAIMSRSCGILMFCIHMRGDRIGHTGDHSSINWLVLGFAITMPTTPLFRLFWPAFH